MKNENTIYTDNTVRIAQRFSSILVEWLGVDKVYDIAYVNHITNNGCCESHNHCDPNEAMIQACEAFEVDWRLVDVDSIWRCASDAWFFLPYRPNYKPNGNK